MIIKVRKSLNAIKSNSYSYGQEKLKAVWSTTEPAEGWDGRYKGNKSVQQGTYTWKLKYTNNLMVTRTLAGHVTILR